MNSTKDPETSIAMIYKYISLTVRYMFQSIDKYDLL
jgi:hypothetical protein